MSLSAKRLGYEFGLTAEEMNFLLKEEGFLDGSPGNYYPTEKGRKYVIEKSENNGYGGYAARSWGWLEWDESIIEKLSITNDRKRKIREKTSEQRRRRRQEKEAQSEEYWRKVNNRDQQSAPAQRTKATENRTSEKNNSASKGRGRFGIGKLFEHFFDN